ncbi:MAG: MATE family efflux transporter, partial [Acidobacteriota bacterium]|nr:MATE family efflux transporter [Acidobacteriota bacterium]
VGMVFQTLYYLVDLYFVGRLGDAAIAGLTGAGNVQFLIMAVTQVLGVGAMVLIAQACGRQDREDANVVFNQTLALSALAATATLVSGYVLARVYMTTLAADDDIVQAGVTYMWWFLPALGLQFALVSMGAALRGTGVVNPTIVVQISTVMLNAILSPIMIAGWGTGRPLGIMGAGLSTSLSVAVAVVMMLVYFVRLESYVRFDLRLMRPRRDVWTRIFAIGLPPGGEIALLFAYLGIVFWTIRGFGPEAQAGFGVGSRVMQAIFPPAMVVAFATAPVAGQNMGAGRHDRVRETYRTAITGLAVIMLSLTLLCQWRPEALIAGFTDESAVIAIGAEFLRIISFNVLATGIVFTNSGMFQAMGNTMPALKASATRIVSFAVPAVLLTTYAGFELWHLWWLSAVTVALQAVMSCWW